MQSMSECKYSTGASMSCCTLATCWSVYLSGRRLHVGWKIWLYDVACCSVCLAAGMPPVAGHVLAAIYDCVYASCCSGYSAIIWPAVGCYIWLYACHPLLSISCFTLAICWLLCLAVCMPSVYLATHRPFVGCYGGALNRGLFFADPLPSLLGAVSGKISEIR